MRFMSDEARVGELTEGEIGEGKATKGGGMGGELTEGDVYGLRREGRSLRKMKHGEQRLRNGKWREMSLQKVMKEEVRLRRAKH